MTTLENDPRTVRRWLVLGLAVSFGVLLVVLISLSIAGLVRFNLAAWQTALLAAFGCGVTMIAWRLDDEDRIAEDAPTRLARAAAAALAGLMFGLLLARSNAAAVLAVGIVVMIWTAAALIRVLELSEPLIAALTLAQHASTSRLRSTIDLLHNAVGSSKQTDDAVRTDYPAPEPLADDVRFQLQRRMRGDGEAIDVQARLGFPDGAVESVLHVPFWPALVSDPHVECEPLDGDDVDLRVTSAERYGIRLEARLPTAAAGSRTVLIGIEIHAVAGEDQLSTAA